MRLVRITVFANGRTDPVVADGSSVILVQGEEVTVGRILFKTYEFMPGEIEHPRNAGELEDEARLLVGQEGIQDDGHDAVFICPDGLSAKMIW